jgi:hypothetical protein
MTHIEKLHLDSLKEAAREKEADTERAFLRGGFHQWVYKKSAEVTENIAIEFADWLNNNSYCWNWYYKKYTKYRIVLPIPESDLKTTKDLFQEYLKQKENDTPNN